MRKQIISTTEAPQAIGAYSQAVRVGDFVFTSGQIPTDPSSGAIVEGDITVQTKRVMDNLAAVLRASGASFTEVVKTSIFLSDLGDFVFTSGQIPLDPTSGAIVEGDITVQTKRVMDNLAAVLRASGAGF
ncbi:MAG: Rid family detoxifying hydrolase, partial [Polyangiaceae bacterium]